GAHERRAAELELREQAGELRNIVRTEHQIDLRQALDELFALLLSDATRNGDQQVLLGLLQEAQAADLAAQFLLRLFSHTAGVEQHEIRVFGRIHLRVAGRAQDLADPLGIVQVHLAAEGDERVTLHEKTGRGSERRRTLAS